MLYECRFRLGVVEEMQLFRVLRTIHIHGSLGQMGDQLAVKGVIVGGRVAILHHNFLRPQPVMVVLEVNFAGGGGGEFILCSDAAGEAGIDGEYPIDQLLVRTIAGIIRNFHLQHSIRNVERMARVRSSLGMRSRECAVYIHRYRLSPIAKIQMRESQKGPTLDMPQ